MLEHARRASIAGRGHFLKFPLPPYIDSYYGILFVNRGLALLSQQ